MLKIQSIMITLSLLFAACQGEIRVPEKYTEVATEVSIFPDYKEITVPPNIAPLNFKIAQEAEAFVVLVKGATQQIVVGAKQRGVVKFDPHAWRALLEEARGATPLQVSVYAKEENKGWQCYKPFTISVANEEIDGYLSYRLIEPGYEVYRQLGLYQRNLSTFEERVIYENNRAYDTQKNHCVNCHNYQNYSAQNMLFHVRGTHGGTVIAQGDQLEKIDLKHDSILSAGVYPSWHPTKPYVVFSTNKTGQAFHINHSQKIEVVDAASDLIFYDVEKKIVRNIVKSDDAFETFPCWTPDGKGIYYCEAYFDEVTAQPDSLRERAILSRYERMRYNLMYRPFDETTLTFGEPTMQLDCAAQGKSVAVPRISPDGRYILLTLAEYGQFHIWHKTADLWVIDLLEKRVRPLLNANSDDADSYHTWSSNGRWMAFSSRRDDGSYTRAYMAYFDKEGRDYKAFMLPQEDPESNTLLLKSYNVPELTHDAVVHTHDDFKKVIISSTSTKVSYRK